MSFQEHKITEYAASIAALPDKIENRAEWLKKQFDARTDSEVKDKHNGLCDALEAETAAADIGAAAPEGVTAAPAGKLQAVLNGMMAGLSAAIQGATGTAVWNDTPDTTLAQARAHEENAQRHVTATERENWNGAAGLMDAIDCGSFTGAPLDALSMHSVNAKAHRMLELDGNTEQAGAQPDTLEEHMTDRSAHGNMIVDGNMG